MKRDLDLIRLLLLEIEKQEEAFSSEHLAVPGYTSSQLAYHVWLLKDAGYIDASNDKDFGSGLKTYTIWAMTFAGHDYLDAVRSSKIWHRVKDGAKEAGVSLTMALVKGLAEKIAAQLVGIAA